MGLASGIVVGNYRSLTVGCFVDIDPCCLLTERYVFVASIGFTGSPFVMGLPERCCEG